jgi:hypothetical protein
MSNKAFLEWQDAAIHQAEANPEYLNEQLRNYARWRFEEYPTFQIADNWQLPIEKVEALKSYLAENE